MSVVSMKALLEAGVHFGHRTRRWNPKMKDFIFTERNGIHIIDLQQTIGRLNDAYELVKETVISGGVILFVGTKRQAQDNIVQEADRAGMPYVEQRWLGGTLTNWRTIRQRIDYLLEAEKQQFKGEFARLVKKEALLREREIKRLNHRLGGLKEMKRLPNLVFVVDVRRDSIAVKEANILGIPIIAMVDTNCNPDPIDHVIPCNDDAIRAIKLVLSTLSNAVMEGKAIQGSIYADEEEHEVVEGEDDMKRYLGPHTLAKIQAAEAKEAATKAVAEVVAKPEAEAEVVAKPEVKAEVVAKPEVKAEVVAKSEAETEVVAKPEVEAEVVAKPEVEAEVVAKPEAEAEVVAKPEVEAEVVTKPEVEAEVVTKPEVEAEVVAKPEVEAEEEVLM